MATMEFTPFIAQAVENKDMTSLSKTRDSLERILNDSCGKGSRHRDVYHTVKAELETVKTAISMLM